AFELRLVIVDAGERSERVLVGDRCRELVETAALIIAMAIDPRVVEAPEGAALHERSQENGLPSPLPGASAADPATPGRALAGEPAAPSLAPVPARPAAPATLPREPAAQPLAPSAVRRAVDPAPAATDTPPSITSPPTNR